jgi:hypothetical protein
MALRLTVRSDHPIKAEVEDAYNTATMMIGCPQDAQGIKILQAPNEYGFILKQRLFDTASRTSSCRGLEKYLSRSHSKARASDACRARTMVLETDRMGVSATETAELYAELSTTSVIYARVIADADYRVAKSYII